jgi:uncharacterized metal-binding protein
MLCAAPVAEAVPALVERALSTAGPRSDNVTVLAMQWETPADTAPDSGGFTETQTMGENVFASTIQPGLADSLPEDLDEEAIERSIAEINEAIRRTAARRG